MPETKANGRIRPFFKCLNPLLSRPLETENWTNPTAVTDLTPEFSAVFNDPEAEDRADRYRIQVRALDRDIKALWHLEGFELEPEEETGMTRGPFVSDLTVAPNQWNGTTNAGEFGLTGTYLIDGEGIHGLGELNSGVGNHVAGHRIRPRIRL